MRIGYFTNQYPAPSHTFIRCELTALEEREHQIRRYAIRPSRSPLVDSADRDELAATSHLLSQGRLGFVSAALKTMTKTPVGVFVAAGRAMRFASTANHSYARHLAYLAEALVLASWCRRDKIEHLHIHFGTNSATVGCLAQALMDASVSVTIHGPEEFDRPERLGLKDKIAICDFTVAVSSYGRSQLLRWARLADWKKIHVVHCGVDERFFNATLPKPVEAPRFVCIGRLSEQKGHYLLLDAAERLKRSGTPFELVLVGDGPLRGEVEKRIRELGLNQSVKLLGTLSQQRVQEELERSRALVLPSFAEGLPVVLMESMTRGRPVIATYIAGIPELVQEDCGWLVPAGDAQALADAMQKALAMKTPDLEAMGHAARTRVSHRHDVRRSAALLEELIIEAVRRRATPTASRGASLAAVVPDPG